MTPTMPDRSAWAWNPRMLLTVLFCSLALNLMVVGTMVGQTLRPVPPSLPSGTAARLVGPTQPSPLRTRTPSERSWRPRIKTFAL